MKFSSLIVYDHNRRNTNLVTWLISVSLIFTSYHAQAISSPHNSYVVDQSALKYASHVKDVRLNFGDYSISRRAVAFGSLYKLWPAAVLPYKMDSGLSSGKQKAFLDACDEWTHDTPLKCQAWSGSGPYFTVKERTGAECNDDIIKSTFIVSCANGLGPPDSEGPRFLYVHPRAWGDKAVLQHEIGHIIGFMHEQQRVDREKYLIYQAKNVIFDYNGQHYDNDSQFKQFPSSDVFTEYDYFSIMHYRNCAFTSPAGGCADSGDFNLQSIAPRQCDKHAIGYDNNVNGAGITALDREGVERAYMGRLMAVFREQRSGACGYQILSVEQAQLTCGADCASSIPSDWTRIAKGYSHEWCTGAFTTPLPDGNAVCSKFGQDYFETKKTSTKWVDRCVTQPQNQLEWNEEWINCGCQSKKVASFCVGKSPDIDVSKIEGLLKGRFQRDRAAGHLLMLVTEFRQNQRMTGAASDALLGLIRKHYIEFNFGPKGEQMVVILRKPFAGRKPSSMIISVSDILSAARKSRLQ